MTWVAAVGFFAFLPTVLKTGAMFHPEPLGMLITAGALLVLARMVRARTYTWKLVVPARFPARGRSAGARLVALDGRRGDRRPRGGRARGPFFPSPAPTAALVTVVLAALVPAPWYLHQATRYSNPVFDRPQEHEFLLALRCPLTFYVDAGFHDVVRRPWQGRFNDRFLPILYAETWADYFGIWAWGPGRADRTDEIDTSLARQSALGLLPTGLAFAGLVALLGLAVTRRREDVGRLVAALPPVAALVSVLYLAVAYPTSDGDTIKGTYALAAAPALALCFGFAVDALSRRRVVGVVLAVAIVGTALALLPFVVW